MCSDRPHPRSGIFSRDAMHAIGGVIIFVRQDLSFCERSTSFLSLLNPYFHYVEVTISLNNFSRSLNVCAPPIRSSPKNGRTIYFSPSTLPSSRNLFILIIRDFNCNHPLWDSRCTSDPHGEVLLDLGSNHLLILLSVSLSQVFCHNERPPSFNFQKARWDDYAFLL